MKPHPMNPELRSRLRLVNGKDDCNCNVAGDSDHAMDHDQHCGFRLAVESANEIERLDAYLAAAVRECEEWNGRHQLCCIAIAKLESVRNAARAVNDESGPDLAPSLSSMAKMAAALHSEWLWRTEQPHLDQSQRTEGPQGTARGE